MTENMMGVAGRLGSSADALAALGALIRIESEHLPVDPEVHAVLQAIGAEVLGAPVAVTAESAPVLGTRADVLRPGLGVAPQPGPHWWVGPGGRGPAAGHRADVDERGGGDPRRRPGAPTLAEQLTGEVRILDIGTGTGWLAIALAEAYPEARVVGIDIFAPALELARANVSAANLDGRVELRQQDALALADTAEFSVVWLPLPFLPATIVPGVLEAVRGSLRPGGWLVAGTFAAGGPGRLAELLMDLRTLRSGGRPWVAEDLLPALTSAGYVDPIAVPRTWPAPVHLFLGRAALGCRALLAPRESRVTDRHARRRQIPTSESVPESRSVDE